MFQDAHDIPTGASLTFDVCIIGAGAAGITLANELSSHNCRIVLLESGGGRRERYTQALYEGDVVDPHRHGPLASYRQRRFGGTTTVWGGRCAPFDDIDFEYRDYVPYSGWPITKKDLESYYRRAHDYLDLGEYSYLISDACPTQQQKLIPGLQGGDVVDHFLWRFSRPTNFASKFSSALQQSSAVTVLLHANCLRLVTNKEGNTISFAEVESLSFNKFRVNARLFLLATGGLETARLLLVSNDTHRNGIGNDYDLVGRFYLSHIGGSVGPVRFTPHGGTIGDFYLKTRDDVYCRQTLAIREPGQKKHGLLNLRVTLTHPPPSDPHHGSSVCSAMYMLKRILAGKIPPEYDRDLTSLQFNHLLMHVRNVIVDSPALLSFARMWVSKRLLSRRKLPSITYRSPSNTYFIRYDSEQSPNPTSRAILSEKRDVFGTRRLAVDWKFSACDVESVVHSLALMNSYFLSSGVGSLELHHETLSQSIRRQVNVGSHHLGLTRMASTPRAGVVDSNCQVFGVHNLFVASSAVFSTSSFANPTLTIVALAIRLGEHLKAVMNRNTIYCGTVQEAVSGYLRK
jgi:choline dehydrogenase-like flavoprotein